MRKVPDTLFLCQQSFITCVCLNTHSGVPYYANQVAGVLAGSLSVGASNVVWQLQQRPHQGPNSDRHRKVCARAAAGDMCWQLLLVDRGFRVGTAATETIIMPTACPSVKLVCQGS